MDPVITPAVVAFVLGKILADATNQRPAPAPMALDVPELTVVAVGGSGAGKTVLLSSMFHELSLPTMNRCYFLDTDLGTRNRLSQTYGDVAHPHRAWPVATDRKSFALTFDCTTWIDEAKAVAFKLNYWEYSGGFIDGSIGNSDESRALDQRISDADAVFGILDGRRVLQYLRDESDGRDYMEAIIQPMLGKIGATIQPRRPVYFVLTKWDVFNEYGGPELRDENTRLAHVANRLVRTAGIGRILNTHPVRLIPVSSVGPDFAQLGPSGTTTKNPRGNCRPERVDVPLSAIIPDLIDQLAPFPDPRNEADPRTLGDLPGQAANWLAGETGRAGRDAFDSSIGMRVVGGESISFMLGKLGGKARERERQRIQWRAEADARAMRNHRARAAILADFRKTTARLEATLPASLLSEGGRS
ncbi:MAG TPA: hypothetical protein VGD84_21495 [Pseudonocardiaceae bacterium]